MILKLPARVQNRAWLWLVPVFLLTIYVHAPSLYMGFTGDDFDWWQLARMGLEEPSLLLADAGTFYRPGNTWSLALDYLLFGTQPVGYHVTNLLLHLTCGLSLWVLLGRFSLPASARSAVTVLWLCSPYSLQPVQWICFRFDPLLLLSWLTLACLWPGPEQRWSRARFAGALVLTGLMPFLKETWVILPGFIFCFDLCLSRAPLRKALYRSALAGLAALVYVVIYFFAFPGDKDSYYSGGLKAAAKIPHAWAVFSSLTTLQPSEFPFGAIEAFSLLIIGALVWLGWRCRSSLMGVGLAFFLLPFLPILPVDFLPTRYTTAPLVGFLMMNCAGIRELIAALKGRQRRVSLGVVTALVLLVLAANLSWLQGDMVDARLFSDAHARLLAETRAFLPYLPRDRLIVAIRLENDNPLVELAARDPYGIPKLYYQRQYAPYGLISWSTLLSYTLDPLGGPLYVEVQPDEAGDSNYAVIGHVRGGFVQLPAEAPTAREAAAAWRSRPAYVRLVKPWGK